MDGLRSELMKPQAYETFRESFRKRLAAGRGASADALSLHDARVRKLETTHRNLVRAVEEGRYNEAIADRLDAVDAELKEMKGKRDAIVPPEIELPENLPELYRELVGNLAATLSDEAIAVQAADELHELVDRIVVQWDAEADGHWLEIEGNLLEMLRKSAPRELDAVRGGAIFAEVGCGSPHWTQQIDIRSAWVGARRGRRSWSTMPTRRPVGITLQPHPSRHFQSA